MEIIIALFTCAILPYLNTLEAKNRGDVIILRERRRARRLFCYRGAWKSRDHQCYWCYIYCSVWTRLGVTLISFREQCWRVAVSQTCCTLEVSSCIVTINQLGKRARQRVRSLTKEACDGDQSSEYSKQVDYQPTTMGTSSNPDTMRWRPPTSWVLRCYHSIPRSYIMMDHSWSAKIFLTTFSLSLYQILGATVYINGSFRISAACESFHAHAHVRLADGGSGQSINPLVRQSLPISQSAAWDGNRIVNKLLQSGCTSPSNTLGPTAPSWDVTTRLS